MSTKTPSPTSWRPGQSGNPKGRPRRGFALAEAIRDGIEPERMIKWAVEIMDDDDVNAADRVAMWKALADRGWIKPPVQVELEHNLTGAIEVDQTVDISALTAEQRAALAAVKLPGE